MSQSFDPIGAARFLAKTFDDFVGGGKSHVMFMGRGPDDRVVVAVTWVGDELVRAMQVEAFLVKQGEAIVHRSQKRGANTILVYKIKQPATK